MVLCGAEVVELLAHLPGEHAEIAGVDADPAEFRARDRDGGCDAGGDVVGVDEQRGADAERFDLGPECRGLVGPLGRGVYQGEGVCAGAGTGNA